MAKTYRYGVFRAPAHGSPWIAVEDPMVAIPGWPDMDLRGALEQMGYMRVPDLTLGVDPAYAHLHMPKSDDPQAPGRPEHEFLVMLSLGDCLYNIYADDLPSLLRLINVELAPLIEIGIATAREEDREDLMGAGVEMEEE